MKILFASRRPTYPFFLGGAEKSFYELAGSLATAGHSVCILGDYQSNIGLADHFFSNSEVEYLKWYEDELDILGKKVPKMLRMEMKGPGGMLIFHNFLPDIMPALQDVIRTMSPDIICTQLEGSVEVLTVAKSWKIPVLHFVRDIFNPLNFFALGLKNSFIGPSLCISNSNFIGDFVQKTFGVETVTVYPMMRFQERLPRKPAATPKRVLFVNPIPSKGGDIMFEIAQTMPEVDFELVPGWGKESDKKWSDLPNVILHYWPVTYIREILSGVDLLVFPAQEGEAFGRISIEAQHAGVPVMASRHSGIEESLADSAILIEDYQNPSAWIKGIRALLADGSQCEQLIRAGEENIKRFSEEKVLAMFEAAAALVVHQADEVHTEE